MADDVYQCGVFFCQDAIMRFAVTWNTNSKHCQEAQFILGVILQSFSPNQLLEFPNIQSTLEGLLPYTDRHFKRMNRLLQQSMFVDYTWNCMGRLNDAPSQQSVDMEGMQEDGDFILSRKVVKHEAENKDSESEGDESDSDSDHETVKTSKPDSDSESSSEESDMEITHVDKHKPNSSLKEGEEPVKESSPIVHHTRSHKKIKLESIKPSLMRDSKAKREIYKSPASVKRKTPIVKK